MTAPMATIRLAREEDAAAMLAIYAPYVRDTAISFETEPPSEEEFRQRVRATLEVGLWLLCEAGGGMLGYAYGGGLPPPPAPPRAGRGGGGGGPGGPPPGGGPGAGTAPPGCP